MWHADNFKTTAFPNFCASVASVWYHAKVQVQWLNNEPSLKAHQHNGAGLSSTSLVENQLREPLKVGNYPICVPLVIGRIHRHLNPYKKQCWAKTLEPSWTNQSLINHFMQWEQKVAELWGNQIFIAFSKMSGSKWGVCKVLWSCLSPLATGCYGHQQTHWNDAYKPYTP